MYSIKNVKIFQSHDGGGFELSLYKDGRRIAIVGNEGNGGEDTWYPINHNEGCYVELKASKESMKLWCKNNLPKWKGVDTMFDTTPDIHIGNLLETFQYTKDLKRLLKKTVIIQGGIVYTLNSKYVQEHKEKILSAYEDSIILNDMSFDDALTTFKTAVGY